MTISHSGLLFGPPCIAFSLQRRQHCGRFSTLKGPKLSQSYY